MYLFDFIIIIALISYGIYGFSRGGVRASLELIFSVISLFFAFLIGSMLSFPLQKIFLVSPSIMRVISILVIWFILESIFHFVFDTKVYEKALVKEKKKFFNKWFGVILGFARGVIFIMTFFILTVTLPLSSEVKNEISHSVIGRGLLNGGAFLDRKISSLVNSDCTSNAPTLLICKKEQKNIIYLSFRIEEFEVDYVAEQEMLVLINNERTAEGLDPLLWDEHLGKAARNHSADMFKSGYFSHQDLDGNSPLKRASEEEPYFIISAENIAYAPTLELAHSGLMESDGHRENILQPAFTRIGIGIIDGGEYGKMFTQVFAD